MLQVYMVRHGKTEMNEKGLLQGRGSDFPLSAQGREQARRAAEWFSGQGVEFGRVFSSPLLRAVETARIVSGVEAHEVVCDDLLLEMDYGPYEGYDFSEHDPAVEAFFKDFVHTPAPKGMEPLAHVQERGARFLEKLAGLEGTVLVSTHAIALKGLLESLDPGSKGSWWARYVGNCSVYRTEAGADGALQPAQLVYSLPR